MNDMRQALETLKHRSSQKPPEFFDFSNDSELSQAIIRNMNEGVCLLRPSDGMIIYANPKFERIFGYDPGELEGKDVRILNRNDETNLADKTARMIIDEVLNQGEHKYEVMNVKKDGTLMWCQATTSIFDHPKFGQILLAVQEDISARKFSEQRLRASERRYRTLIEEAYDSIVVVDEGGVIKLVNKQLTKTFGYTLEELRGKTIEFLIPERFRSRHIQERENYQKNPEARPMGRDLKLVALAKDGREIPVDISLSPIEMDEGPMVNAVIRDVSERRKNETRETFLAELGRSLSETMDVEERIRIMARLLVPQISDACAISLLEKDELTFKTGAIQPPQLQERFCEVARKAISESYPISARVVIESGKPLLIEDLSSYQASQLLDPHHYERVKEFSFTSYIVVPILMRGKVLGSLSLCMTDSRRKFSQEDLLFLEVVASRFAFAFENARLYQKAKEANFTRQAILSIVCHELKNPVATINLSADMILRKELTPQNVHQCVDRVKVATQHMQKLLADLLDFGKMQAGTFSVEKAFVELKDLLDFLSVTMTSRMKEKNISFQIATLPTPEKIYCDKDRLLQVLWNLLGNALKFTPNGGHVVLSIEARLKDILFTVKDNGSGIRSENLANIFDMFWQAKDTSSMGTGLGLSISKNIVEAHGGRIWAESTVGEGAQFFFTLPSAPQT